MTPSVEGGYVQRHWTRPVFLALAALLWTTMYSAFT